ncbi:MAG: NAD(P)H-dependent oxidoreductase [Candidatus Omnitrophota bacterium]|nr:NAD(P)H-dependent oxidoreductase [Candidatus Omnitrophota bacterium]
MKKLLHIIATPRQEESRTLKVTEAFFEGLENNDPDCRVDTLNVAKEKLPPMTIKAVSGKYVLLGGKDLPEELKPAWEDIIKHIERFLSADGYLISSPMWNFSIPYYLKHYIDVILQPRYLFRYTEKGPEGLVKNKKMVVITSRGGDYGPDSPSHSYDFQEPYLNAVFGLAGITGITFINSQPMDALGPEIQKQRIDAARKIAKKAGEGFFSKINQ